MAPGFVVGVIPLEKMGEVFGFRFTEGAIVGDDGTVPVCKFCSWKNAVTKLDKLSVTGGHFIDCLLEGRKVDGCHRGFGPLVVSLDALE
jgi:hypothetical protein